MSDPILRVQGLKTWLKSPRGEVRAVDGVDFELHRGETYALLGESGCGKSMTALSLMGLVPQPAGRIVAGKIEFDGEDISHYSELQWRRIRGRRLGMIFQEPMTSLNPVLTIGDQIGEVCRRHLNMKGKTLRDRVVQLLDQVGIPDPAKRVKEYPHQLSGGMKQRVMIAIALAAEPEILIADEPTTALDVTIQAQILDLLAELQEQRGMAMLLITHDLGVVAQVADRIGVMYAGQIVEQAEREQFFSDPRHPYSKRLFASLPSADKRAAQLTIIPGSVPPLTQEFNHCRFADRCDAAWEHCQAVEPRWLGDADRGVRCHLYDPQVTPPAQAAEKAVPDQDQTPTTEPDGVLLDVRDLKVHFPIHKGVFKRVVGHVHAVDGVSLTLRQGETLALVGESGCGKTTVGKGLLQLMPQVTQGQVHMDGIDLSDLHGEALRKKRRDVQIIFQDPYASMNPRMLVGDIIEEGMSAQGIGKNRVERQIRVAELLEQVGLSADMRDRYPHEFSGGQRQRICIARALAVSPRLLVCDEPTSALDVSVQAQVLNLLKRLQAELGLTYLFITHDISVVAYLAHQVAVMYLGRIVEQGPVEEVLGAPKHPYTRALLSAVPRIEADAQQQVIRLQGDLPSPIHPPAGCHFHPRCPEVMPQCRERYPDVTGAEHITRCFLYEGA